MNTKMVACISLAAMLTSGTAAAASLGLGAFQFDTARFGDTLAESDGGTFRTANWLNTVNADPGTPGALTGANFNTGIANINSVIYTIGYSTGIVNGAGADFGVVTARFSSDTIDLTVNGTTLAYGPALGIGTGVFRDFFYGGPFVYDAQLFVTPVDLSDFGLAAGAVANSISVTSGSQLDLIRIAGFDTGTTVVPVPGAMLLMVSGLLGIAGWARRKRS